MSLLPAVLGTAWGALVAFPLVGRARRVAPSSRAATLAPMSTPPATPSWRVFARVPLPAPVARVARGLVARRRARANEAAVRQELPIVIDLLAVAVGAGCTPYLAVGVAASWSPPVMAARLESVRHACDLGAGFTDALERMADATPSLSPLVDALLASDRFGAPVGEALGRLAAEERSTLRRVAETRARKVPVRLLFPLVFLVLPAFALLTVAPALLAGLGRG